jgi:tRNA(Ile)-lysidine synthase
VPYRVDPTNEDGSNLRSRLRRDVVPPLLRENPELARAIGRTATLLAALDDFVEDEARRGLAALRRPGATGELVLDGPAGRAYHRFVLSTILRNAIRGVSPAAEVGFDPLERLVRTWQANGVDRVDLPGGVSVRVEPERVVVGGRGGAAPGLAERDLPVPGSLPLDGLDASLRIEAVTPPPADAAARSSGTVAWLDAHEVRPPLRVRGRRAGDRYRPLGLPGSAKVQDLMVDRKIPRRLRDAIPVVVDGRGILWIPGFRVDARSRITGRTRTALRIEVTGRLPWAAEAESE